MNQVKYYLNKKIDPTLLIVLVASFLVICIGVIRPPEGVRTDLNREGFWRNKLDQPPIYDLVIGGDSRILCDISPSAMSSVLNMRIYNFGFNFVGYTPEYLKAIEQKLNPNSNEKTIVLGITPRSLTPLNMKTSGFAEENNRELYEKIGQKYLNKLSTMFRPFSLSSIVWSLQGRVTAKDFYPDGLMSVEILPPDDDLDLKTYKKIFINNTVSEEHINNIFDTIRDWKAKGITVYGFRPPVAEKIFEAEGMSGFNQNQFIKGFQNAGGVWLNMDANGITFADGSHITANDVPRFSKNLAQTIEAAKKR